MAPFDTNRRIMATIATMIVGVFMCASCLCACGKKKQVNSLTRASGQYGYRGTYIDIPSKEGYFLLSLGDVFLDNDRYCLSAVYSHYDDNGMLSDYITDIFSVDMNGTIQHTLEISQTQAVRAVFEKEYAFFAYSNQDLIAVQNGEKDQSQLKADLVFFDKKTGETTRVIHPDFNADAVFVISEGFVIVGDRSISKYTSDGKLLSTLQTDFSMIPRESVIFEDSGSVYLMTSNNEWIYDYYKLDFETGKATYIIGSDSLSTDVDSCSGQYFFGQKGEYRVDLTNMQIQPMALWNEIDIRPKKMSNAKRDFIALDETHFAQKTIYMDGTGEIGFFSYDNTIRNDYTPIVVGGYGVYNDEMLQWAIYEFNINNDKYRVVLEDYSEEFSYGTPQEAQMANLKLIKYFNDGHSPDIFYGDSFDYDYFGHAGMLKDMMPFFEKDESLLFSDFTPGIQSILMPDGVHCYSVFSGYYMDGYWGQKKDFQSDQVSLNEIRCKCQTGDKRFTAVLSSPCIAGESLTYRFVQLWGAYGKQKSISREEIIDFVNTTIELGIDPSISWGNVCDMNDVYDGICYLSTAGPSDVFSWDRETKKAENGLIYVGYPSINGSVHLLVPSGLVGISSSTENEDKCWEFIRKLILPDIQKKVVQSGNIPVRNGVLEMMYQSAMDPNSVVDEDMRRFVLGKSAVSAETIEEYKRMIDSIDTIRTMDWGVYNIICEEIASYYTQNRSVEQIADTLDARLSLYAQENYS